MNINLEEFPFKEIRDEQGDYFNTVEQATELGYADTQIWSVVEEDNVFVYGPPYHKIGVNGYIATKEHHDYQTYYEENVMNTKAKILHLETLINTLTNGKPNVDADFPNKSEDYKLAVLQHTYWNCCKISGKKPMEISWMANFYAEKELNEMNESKHGI